MRINVVHRLDGKPTLPQSSSAALHVCFGPEDAAGEQVSITGCGVPRLFEASMEQADGQRPERYDVLVFLGALHDERSKNFQLLCRTSIHLRLQDSRGELNFDCLVTVTSATALGESLDIHVEGEKVVLRRSSGQLFSAGPLVVELWSETRVKERPEKLQGVYCCRGDREDEDIAICTHLEPAFCRNVIPCCDAPHLKAVFHTTVVAPVNWFVVSVALLAAKGPAPDVELDTFRLLGPSQSFIFEETMVPIPTYIWGFWAFSHAQVVDHGLVQGTPVRTIFMKPAAVGESDEGDTKELELQIQAKTSACSYAATWGAYALKFFSDKFRMMPPLQKLDFLPLPGLNGLGMENFAAITTLETYFLVTSKTPYQRRRRIARLLCHEVSHQWYGNFVTPTSFNDLWIKEGMARLLEFVSLEAGGQTGLERFNTWNHFLSSVFSEAMAADARLTSHPVVQEHRNSLEAILSSFDVITYGKGACLLRMLADFIGMDAFWDGELYGIRYCGHTIVYEDDKVPSSLPCLGLNKYILQFQGQCASCQDLWDCMQLASESPLLTENSIGDGSANGLCGLMQPWLQQAGFPLLCVELAEDSSSLSLSQLPFLLRDADATVASSVRTRDVLWPIPLRLRIGRSTMRTRPSVLKERLHVLECKGDVGQETEEDSTETRLFMNTGHSGFFITLYDRRSWSAVTCALRSGELSALEVQGLAYDLFFLHSLATQEQSCGDRILADAFLSAAAESGERLLVVAQILEKTGENDEEARHALAYVRSVHACMCQRD